MEEKPRVFIGVASYNGDIEGSLLTPILTASKHGGVYVTVRGGSLLAYNFNKLYCEALNRRGPNALTHFCLIHADLQIEPNWLKTMLSKMEEFQADILSAVIPIKSKQGLTSTALDEATPEDPWGVKRLTMKEIMDWPETFTHEKLLINTGLLLVRLDRMWSDKLYFTINDKISVKDNGEYFAKVESEDWFFSRQARLLGLKLYATRAVKIGHIGRTLYPNWEKWGLCETDPRAAKGSLNSDEK